MSFWVIDLEVAPPRLRGILSRFSIELRAGLYVGTTSAKTRDAIWKIVDHEIATETRAVMVFPSSSRPMGFEARTLGLGRREVVDIDGLLLARFLPVPDPANAAATVATASAIDDDNDSDENSPPP